MGRRERSSSLVLRCFVLSCVVLLQGGMQIFDLRADCVRVHPNEFPTGSLNNGKCRLIINELNVYPNGINQFVELKKVCDLKYQPDKQFPVNMKFYRLLVITHDAYLVTACHLESKAKAKKGSKQIFYSLSAVSDENSDMDLRKCHFASHLPPNRIPLADSAPMAIALIYNSDVDTIKGVDLVEEQPGVFGKTKIDNRMEKKILENLMDLVIFTTSSPYTSCKYFERYFSSAADNPVKIVRDWGQLEESLERSLSRCPTSKDSEDNSPFLPFQSAFFKYAPLSKGEENKCQDSVDFDYVGSQPPRKVPRRDFLPEYECMITTTNPAIESSHMIGSLSDYNQQLKKLIEDFQRSRTASSVRPEVEVNLAPLGKCNLELVGDPKLVGTAPVPSFTPIKLDDESFDQQMSSAPPVTRQDCKDFQPADLIPTLKTMEDPPIFWEDVSNTDTCFWFDWLPSKRMRCRLCNQLLQQGIIKDRPGSPKITKIMTVGQINKGKKARTLNRRIINRHIQNPLHQIAVDYLKLYQEGLRGEDLTRAFQRTGGPLRNYTNATENLFTLGFTMAEIDLPFQRYPRVRELTDVYGVNVGHLYNNPSGIHRVQLSISDSLHKQLIHRLLESKPEFSLLIDASTDVASLPALAIVLQTFDEKNDVKPILYKVLWVTGRETAENLWNLFLNEITKDGLRDYVREKCIGFASDGGSNVLLFREYLKKFTDHSDKMLMVYCQAHRTERVMKHAWEKFPYLLNIDSLINKLHRIFQGRSAKKNQHLQQAQKEQDDTNFTLKRLQQTRWVNARFRAIEKIILHWKTIIKALKRVLDDPTIKDKQQREAAEVALNTLMDPTFLITTAFVLDVFTAMSSLSLKLQDRGTTLIGKKEKRDKLKATLNTLSVTEGPFQKQILGTSKFSSPAYHGKTMSLELFETGNVIFNGVALHKADPKTEAHRLYRNRKEYANAIVEQLDLYFPTDPTDDFDVFDPSHWPLQDVRGYGSVQLKEMNLKLKWNFPEQQLLQGWEQLKLQLVKHPEFGKQSREHPENFWSYFLKLGGIEWSSHIRQIITNIITVPASTAEVERIFSYYTQTKTVRRFRLTVASVEALIRIRFNGPKRIADFKPFDYVWDFLDKHARSDDTSILASKKPKEDSEDSSPSSANGVQNDPSITSNIPVALGDDDLDDELQDDGDSTWNSPNQCDDGPTDETMSGVDDGNIGEDWDEGAEDEDGDIAEDVISLLDELEDDLDYTDG